jgi:hypothetical protein
VCRAAGASPVPAVASAGAPNSLLQRRPPAGARVESRRWNQSAARGGRRNSSGCAHFDSFLKSRRFPDFRRMHCRIPHLGRISPRARDQEDGRSHGPAHRLSGFSFTIHEVSYIVQGEIPSSLGPDRFDIGAGTAETPGICDRPHGSSLAKLEGRIALEELLRAAFFPSGSSYLRRSFFFAFAHAWAAAPFAEQGRLYSV